MVLPPFIGIAQCPRCPIVLVIDKLVLLRPILLTAHEIQHISSRVKRGSQGPKIVEVEVESKVQKL